MTDERAFSEHVRAWRRWDHETWEKIGSLRAIPAANAAELGDWGVAETAAWALMRDLDLVGRVLAHRLKWDAYGGCIGDSAACTAAAELPKFAVTISEIQSQAANELLHASGVSTASKDDRQPIPRADWRDMRLSAKTGALGNRWSQVVFPKAEVRAVWPSIKPGSRVIIGNLKAEEECEAWLKACFGDPSCAEFEMKREAFQETALARWAGKLSGRGFVAAWKGATASFPARRQSGRPRNGA